MTDCHDDMTNPALVAHRGYAKRYPENTLVSIRAALEAGVGAVEFDVQLTADRVPVVLHDTSLQRTAGVDREIFDLPLARAREIDVGEPQRFGAAFSGVTLPTLAEMVELLDSWPDATAFVELKRESLRGFGVATVVGRVLEDLRPILKRAVVISFDREAVAMARDRGAAGIGWVIDRYDGTYRALAEALAPEYLFCDRPLIPRPPETLWPGPWRWVVYGIETVEAAIEMARRGVQFVETMAVSELLHDARLAP